MGILQTVAREHIKFDPASKAHRAAFWQLRTTGKQNERLRFILEEGYGSVLTMMQDRLACYFSEPKSVKQKSDTWADVTEEFYKDADKRVVCITKGR